MAKKKETESFDLNQAIEECPKPDFFKRAFLLTWDVSEIKSKDDLIKDFKTYGELK